jgi:DNA polymerase delta subunit 2
LPAEEAIERTPSVYAPQQTYVLARDKNYRQQYGDMYFLRLAKLKPVVEKVAAEAWNGLEIGGQEVSHVERVLDVRQGSLCWVTGTIYMDMPLKPNILDDISKDHWVTALPPREKYISPTGEDLIMLEDESGRLRLTGAALADEMLVTGCIVSVMGTENANGDFEVIDVKVPGLPPQPRRWTRSNAPNANSSARDSNGLKQEDEDTSMADTPNIDTPRGHQGKIAIVSGLGISGNSAEKAVQTDLLSEFLIGEAFDPKMQHEVSKIGRLVIAGNSLAGDNDALTHDTIGNTRKSTKKYGYDSSAYNPAPTAHLDNFLASILPSLPVTLLPGIADPANVSMPQQPIHSAMFPQAREYASMPPEPGQQPQPGWYDSVTNPWDGEVEGWKVLGTGGQNLDDIFKYVESNDRLGMMEAMCRWRCVAPTAPDTLCKFCYFAFPSNQ